MMQDNDDVHMTAGDVWYFFLIMEDDNDVSITSRDDEDAYKTTGDVRGSFITILICVIKSDSWSFTVWM